jgi:parallel beta-helix repeat protein
MKRASRWVGIGALVAVIVVVLLFAFRVVGPSRWPEDAIVVPRDVPTLGEALERVGSGGTIVLQIRPEAHYGPVIVEVPGLTLIAASDGVGFEGLGSAPAITVRADGVTVRGFDITSDSIGLRVESMDCLAEELAIRSAPIGIQLSGSRRCVLRGIELSGGRVGVELVSAVGNRLQSIDIEGMSEVGLKVVQSRGNVLDRVFVSGASVGLSIEQASAENQVIEASIGRCSIAGVAIRASNDNRLTESIVTDSRIGVLLEAVTGNTVRGCTIDRAAAAGVSLQQAAQNRILECRIADSETLGLILSQSVENAISYNAILRCDEGGILLESSDRNLIMANRLTGNAIGIAADRSDDNRFLRNTMVGSERIGVLLSEGRGSRLLDNEIRGGSLGIALESTEATVLIRNGIERQSVGGVSLVGAAEANTVTENEIRASGFGIFITGAAREDVLDNRLTDNDVGLLLLHSGPGIRLEGNVFERNAIGLEYAESVEVVLEERLAALNIDAGLSLGPSVPPVIVGNTFARNETADIANRTDSPLYAAGNWWGDGRRGAEAATTVGPVHLEQSAWWGTVAVGTEAGSAQVILGRILQFALEEAGYRVIDLVGLGESTRVAAALEAQDVDLIWWDAGTDSIPEGDEAHVLSIPAHDGWTVVASPSLVERLLDLSLSSLSALGQIPGEVVRFAAPEAFGAARFSAFTAAYGLSGAAAVITWTRTLSEAEAMVKFGASDVVIARNLEETLTLSGFSALADDLEALESSAIAVVSRGDLLRRHPGIDAVLSALVPYLTTEALHDLNSRVRLLDREPEAVAREFLKRGRPDE